jgi:hypothetical protein
VIDVRELVPVGVEEKGVALGAICSGHRRKSRLTSARQ